MSRFSGPQGYGAARELRVSQRAEAETRQAAERERDQARRASYVEPPPLTDEELLILAAIALPFRIRPTREA